MLAWRAAVAWGGGWAVQGGTRWAVGGKYTGMQGAATVRGVEKGGRAGAQGWVDCIRRAPSVVRISGWGVVQGKSQRNKARAVQRSGGG